MAIMDIVIFCGTDIRCDNAGKAQLLQHTAKKKHKEAIKHFQDNKQTKLLFPVSQSGQCSSTASAAKPNVFINYGDASLEADIYWLEQMACNNYSLRSSDHIEICLEQCSLIVKLLKTLI